MQQAKVICDSISDKAPRLHTQFWRYPSMVHQETLRHRKLCIHDQLSMKFDPDFSFSVSSTRAIPFHMNLIEVRDCNKRARPAEWGSEKKGMSPGDELTSRQKELMEIYWNNAAMMAAEFAQTMADVGAHKSICNRIIAPYLHTNCLTTGTEPGWMNFFGLRLDKGADPTVRALAEESWKAWNESQPRKLQQGEWHLPFVDEDNDWFGSLSTNDSAIKVSVARCARLSYMSFETGERSTIEEDLCLYNKLVGSIPIHASPAEHQATPDVLYPPEDVQYPFPRYFEHRHQAGNLGPGWRQYRKMLPNESVAPLPEQHR